MKLSRIIRRIKNKLFYKPSYYSDITDNEFLDLWNSLKPYTMTSIERMYSLYKSIEHVVKNNIEGDIVECGVWRGGSAMLIAKYLLSKGIINKRIFLYDTFEGMSNPTDVDRDMNNKSAKRQLSTSDKNDSSSIWCVSAIDEVRNNMISTGYPINNINFVRGKVEDTIPNTIPDKVSLLRLDTDWYESTKHELYHLYPVLVKSGVLIIDDYGHWQGCRQAVDEYFQEQDINIFLHRIDYTGRVAVKP